MNANLPERSWASELQAFSRRNGGRLVRLEGRDLETGGAPMDGVTQLRAVAYNPVSQSLALTVKRQGYWSSDVTYHVRGVSAIEVAKSWSGRDIGLWIATARGHSSVRFCST